MVEVHETVGKLAVTISQAGARREKWMDSPADLAEALGAPPGHVVTEVTVTVAQDGNRNVNVVWEQW